MCGPANPAACRTAARTELLVSELAADPDLSRLVDQFVGRLDSKVCRMTECLSSNRLDELAKLAHQLKGSGGGYGFPGISDAARKVEEHAKGDSDLGQVRTAVAELTSLCRQAIAGGTRSREASTGFVTRVERS